MSDYISALPWNDPFNPWIDFTRLNVNTNSLSIILSDEEGSSFSSTLNLVQFDPFAVSPNPSVTYVNINSSIWLRAYNDSSITWNLSVNFDNGIYSASLTTPNKSIPYKTSDTTNWVNLSGSGIENIRILRSTAGTKTNWEKRRIAGGTG